MKPDLSIVMCAYNEIGRIQSAIDDLDAAAANQYGTYEVFILDNGSTDGTKQLLEKLHRPGIKVIFNETNLGKGGSVKKGIKLSTGRYVVVHDCDAEYRATDLWALMDAAKEDGVKMVLGSRWLGGGDSYKYVANYIGVKFLTHLTNLLYGSTLTDAATALKLMDGKVARDLNLISNGFELDFEIVARMLRLGHKITERQAEYFPRSKEEGKKVRAVRDGIRSLAVLIRDRFLLKRQFTVS